ncbi:MAG: hypothetical protein Q8Q52_07090 [Acidimicrobiia bacterium]|nr:hypothetical protein [Acidimicrobiia bacterium]
MTGRVMIIGSGELGPSMVPVFRSLNAEVDPSRVVVLDGSYRFQANGDELSEKIVDHLARSVGWRAEVATSAGSDPIDLAVKIAAADLVFAGPGSPTYALRQWNHPPVIEALVSVVEAGGTLVMASAAALTLGVKALPIYEIYKAGEEPRWIDGLDVLGRLGLEAVVIPHWNNREGGTHDTSHCFMGQARFAMLERMLAPSTTVIGVDEHTAMTIEAASGARRVEGAGSITIRLAGSDLPLSADQSPRIVGHPTRTGEDASAPPGDAIDDAAAMVSAIVEAADDPHRLAEITAGFQESQDEKLKEAMADYVGLVVELREEARAEGRYGDADAIRQRLAGLGVSLSDTPEGTTWIFTDSGLVG